MANFIIFLILICATAVNAAPAISTISDDTPANDQSVTLTGTGFTSHGLDIEWLGGSSGNIESGTNGVAFSKTSWAADSTNAATQAPLYSTTRAHSGTKSIMSSFPLESQYDSGFEYQYGSDFDEIYAVWYVYFDRGGSPMGGQWKQFRLRPTSGYNNADGEVMVSGRHFYTGLPNYELVMMFCDVDSYGQCYEDGTGSQRWVDDYYVDQWFMVEFYAKASSVANTADGQVIINFYDQTGTVAEIFSYDELITRISESDAWNRLTFQNYWGNRDEGGDGTSEKIYMDDVYVQIGDRAHIMIGDNATYTSCTHLEIQHPTAWSTTSITFDINQGSFASDSTGYVFVIDSSGVASTGKQVTFGEGGSSAAASIARTETGLSMVKSGTGCSFTKGE